MVKGSFRQVPQEPGLHRNLPITGADADKPTVEKGAGKTGTPFQILKKKTKLEAEESSRGRRRSSGEGLEPSRHWRDNHNPGVLERGGGGGAGWRDCTSVNGVFVSSTGGLVGYLVGGWGFGGWGGGVWLNNQ